MALLNRAQILAKKNVDRPYKDYAVKAWGGDMVRIRGLSAKFREKAERRFAKATEVDENHESLRCWLISVSLVNEVNELLFSSEDVKLLEENGQDPIIELFDEIMAFNGFSKAAQEELKKNSPRTTDEGSPCSSPSPSTNHVLTASSAE